MQIKEGENLLKAIPNYGIKKEPNLRHQFNFKAYGCRVWVASKSVGNDKISTQRNLNQLFLATDPYISYGNYTTAVKDENYIVLNGEESPISGIRLTKNIIIGEYDMIDDCYNVIIEAIAENIRKEPIAWDLWMITRVNGHNLNFVPVSDENVSVSSQLIHTKVVHTK